MDIQIFTLCDSAQEYNGKLVIVGAFNEITASSFPAVHPEMAIVVRTIIENEDKEGHDVEISAFKSDTGKEGCKDCIQQCCKAFCNTCRGI